MGDKKCKHRSKKKKRAKLDDELHDLRLKSKQEHQDHPTNFQNEGKVKHKRKTALDYRKYDSDDKHKSRKRKNIEVNHSESSSKKVQITSNGGHFQKNEQSHLDFHQSKGEKKKKRKHKKSSHTDMKEGKRKKDKISKNMYKKVLQKENDICSKLKNNREIVKNARKSTSSKSEFEKFIVENDLAHYVWQLSSETQNILGFRQGKWTKKEEKILKENVERFTKHNNIEDPMDILLMQQQRKTYREFIDRTGFYQEISKGLKRTLNIVDLKFIRNYDKYNNLGTRFSPNEDKELLKLVSVYGKKWLKIGLIMGKSRGSLGNRYQIIKDKHHKGPWHDEEVERLKKAVRHVTGTQNDEYVWYGINWKQVASLVKTRHAFQCREKWLYNVCFQEFDPFSKGRKNWNKVNDVELINKIYECKETEECDIDWLALSDHFGCSSCFLRVKFSNIKRKYCTSIDFVEVEFEEIMDYLYNDVAVNLQKKILQDGEESTDI